MKELSSLTAEARNHIIEREEKSLWTYIRDNLFEYPREEGILNIFAGLEGILSTHTATKGHGFISTESYSLQTEEILKEVDIFCGLVADRLISTLDASERTLITKEHIAKLTTRFVFDEVNYVYDESEFGGILTYNLFLELPHILNARTKPASGGFIGLLAPMETDSSEFESSLRDPIGTTLYNLKKRAMYFKEKTKEFRRTNSQSLRMFLLYQNPDLIKFGKFKKDKQVSDLIEKLDEIYGSFSSTSSEPDSDHTQDIVNIIQNLNLQHSNLQNYQFRKVIEKVSSKLEKCATINLAELTTKLILSTVYHPQYESEIFSGKSIVEKFEDPQYIKNMLERRIIQPNDKNRSKEYAFAAVLIEMKPDIGFCDNVYVPLANMLLAQNNGNDCNYTSLAFKYAFYVNLGGSINVLRGLESEPIKIKEQLLDVLDYNQEHEIVHMETYEIRLRKQLSDATDKNVYLEEEKKRLEKERIAIEIREI